MSFGIYAHIDEKHDHINAPKVDVNTLFKNVINEIILRSKDEFIKIKNTKKK
jgi:hypothetical protein